MSEATRVERPTRAENRPVAVPWVLGLYGLAGATFVVAAYMARWYGGAGTAWLLAPLVVPLGIAVLLGGMWAYEAHDALGTAILGTWGAFWIAYGLLNAFFATGLLAEPKGASPELGFWFIALSVITWMGTIAAFGESLGLVAALGTLAAGSTIAVFAELLGSGGLAILAGWLLILASVCG